jgi:ferredoxin
MAQIKFVRERKTVEADNGANLADVMRANGIDLSTLRVKLCGGHGVCGGCRVLIRGGDENVSPKTWVERLRLAISFLEVGHESDLRLACQVLVKGDVVVETAPKLDWWGRPIRYVTRESD